MDDVTATKTRPGWVWLIFIWYCFAFVYPILLMYLVISGSVPLTSQAKASLSNATTFNYVEIVMHLLLTESAAIVLFLLRREATYLFFSLFVVNLATLFYHRTLLSGFRSNTIRSGLMELVAIGANLVIWLYCERLKRNGMLT